MADFMKCPSCGATDQEVGKFCEQCGSKVEPAAADVASDAAPAADAAPSNGGVAANGGKPDADGAGGTAVSDDPLAPLRFIRLENGIFNRDQAFDVPVGSRLLVGRTDPVNGVFPEVDVTMWSARVPTPEGALYTIHRKQCTISRDHKGRVWIVDYPDYEGDTMVSPHGSSQFQTIPSLSDERDFNDEGAVALEVGDRILMGQGEGMLIFTLVQL